MASILPAPKEAVCLNCDANFASNNELYKHLRSKDCRPVPKSGAASPKAGPDKPCSSTELQSSPPPTLASSEAWLKMATQGSTTEISAPKLIRSTATKPQMPGFGFKSFRYATCAVRFSPTSPEHGVCVDTGCTMSLIDRKFLQVFGNGGIKVYSMPSPMTVTGIGKAKHNAN